MTGLAAYDLHQVAVPSDMPAIHAFKAVLDSHVGCAGIVDLRRWASGGAGSLQGLQGLQAWRAGRCTAIPSPWHLLVSVSAEPALQRLGAVTPPGLIAQCPAFFPA